MTNFRAFEECELLRVIFRISISETECIRVILKRASFYTDDTLNTSSKSRNPEVKYKLHFSSNKHRAGLIAVVDGQGFYSFRMDHLDVYQTRVSICVLTRQIKSPCTKDHF